VNLGIVLRRARRYLSIDSERSVVVSGAHLAQLAIELISRLAVEGDGRRVVKLHATVPR
jgi:hypothetical protein